MKKIILIILIFFTSCKNPYLLDVDSIRNLIKDNIDKDFSPF